MNLVAHQLLSFKNQDWQLGNYMGEVIKGKNYEKYSPEIAKGILLHRHIDSFTDEHSITKHSTAMLHSEYGKYSPIIVDIFYDYFLIKNWNLFSPDESFTDFKKRCYLLFKDNLDLYPSKLKSMTTILVQQDWFSRYGQLTGVEQTLKELSTRTKFPNKMHSAAKALYMKENALKTDFLSFFPELEKSCRNFLEI